jgi:hypothetical protein
MSDYNLSCENYNNSGYNSKSKMASRVTTSTSSSVSSRDFSKIQPPAVIKPAFGIVTDPNPKTACGGVFQSYLSVDTAYM